MSADSQVDREERVNEIIADWYRAQDEGENPNAREWIDRYPEFRDELERFLGAADGVIQFQEQMDDPKPATNVLHASHVTPTLEMGKRPNATSLLSLSSILPRRFGDYELLQEIARGGMGIVYKASQVSLHRVVALKMILAGRLASSADVQRFRVEAETAATLDHPNIVPIHEVGEYDGQHFFTMKYIEGTNLAAERQEFAKDHRSAGRLMVQVARAVQHAHAHGVLHRDLKPANILLQAQGSRTVEYVPYVTDFGLAKLVREDSGLTQTGDVVGTPNYMAPEQAAGSRNLTTSADIFSLGAILYELLTGRKPFQADSPLATLELVRTMEPERPSALCRGIDRDLETICLTCLHKEPRDRYASAEILADDLEHWLRGEPIKARPATPWERFSKWVRRRPASAAAVLAFCMFFVLSFALITWKWLEAEQAKSTVAEHAHDLKKQRDSAEAARHEAIEQRKQAVAARDEAKRMETIALQEKKAADTARDRLSSSKQDMQMWFSYSHRIALAEREFLAGNLDRARAHLNECMPFIKKTSPTGPLWEYRYLNRLTQGEKAHVEWKPFDEAIVGLAWTPEGRLVVGSAMGTIVILDADGKELHRLNSGIELRSLKLLPNNHILLAGAKRELAVWDPAGEGKVTNYVGAEGPISAVAVGDEMILAASGTKILAWKAGKAEAPEFVLDGHEQPILDLCIVSSEKHLQVLSADDKEVKLWDLGRREALASLKGDGFLYIRDYQNAVGIGMKSGAIRLCVVKNNKIMEFPAIVLQSLDGQLRDFAATKDHKRYFLAGDSAISVFDLSTVLVFSLHVSGDEPFRVLALSADGNRVAAAQGKVVHVWNGSN